MNTNEVGLAKLKAEFEPQTPEERKDRLKKDVAADSAPEPPEIPSPSSHLRHAIRSDFKTREMLVATVVSRLGEIAPPIYELQEQVKAAGSSLYLDALLVSEIDQAPDFVVVIRTAGISAAKNARDRMADLGGHRGDLSLRSSSDRKGSSGCTRHLQSFDRPPRRGFRPNAPARRLGTRRN